MWFSSLIWAFPGSLAFLPLQKSFLNVDDEQVWKCKRLLNQKVLRPSTWCQFIEFCYFLTFLKVAGCIAAPKLVRIRGEWAMSVSKSTCRFESNFVRKRSSSQKELRWLLKCRSDARGWGGQWRWNLGVRLRAIFLAHKLTEIEFQKKLWSEFQRALPFSPALSHILTLQV